MIKVNHLSKKFGNLEVLKDINLDINEGEVVCIIGPSGSGKSTFLRCINQLERPTGGTVQYEGKNLLDKNCDIRKFREEVGMVFQKFNLFPYAALSFKAIPTYTALAAFYLVILSVLIIVQKQIERKMR